MKKYLLTGLLIMILSFCFSSTILEISQDYGRRLAYHSTLDQSSIDKLLEGISFNRLFLITLDDVDYCSLLRKNAGGSASDMTIMTYRVSDFSKTESRKCELALKCYLQLQRSLFDHSDIFSPFSSNKLILDDMSYIEFFISNLQRLEGEAENYFKENVAVSAINQYVTEKHRLNMIFYNNFENFFNSKEIDFSPTVYEEDSENLSGKACDFFDDEIKNAYSQLELYSFMALLDDYVKTIVENATVTSEKIPYVYLFDSDKKKNALITTLYVDFLKYISKSVQSEINALNKEISKRFGVADVASLESLLLLETKFEMMAYKVLEFALKAANSSGKVKAVETFVNADINNTDVSDYLKGRLQALKTHLLGSWMVLSGKEDSVELMTALEHTRKNPIKKLTPEVTISEKFEDMELIRSWAIEENDAHFAVVKSKINLTGDASESFSKVYPIFPTECTSGKPLVLVDFFWASANQFTQTLWKTFRTFVLNGFDLKKLGTELSVKDVEVSVQEYIQLQPFHELYRVMPSYDRRMTLETENTNLAHLILDNLFAGNIPSALADTEGGDTDIKEYSLNRYPIEMYRDGQSISSDVQRKKKTIIFVHGKQSFPYFDAQQEVVPHVEAMWRNVGRIDVWDSFFDYVNQHSEAFAEYDFYEYTYDTSVYPASYYGKMLSELIIENDILKDYEEISMIAHSMGGLVSRFCINNVYNNVCVGDHIKQLITMDTPHLGTLAQNYILTINSELIAAVDDIVGTPPDINLTMGNFLYSFIDGNEAKKSAELMLYFSRKRPEMVGKIFTEMLRSLDPFPGGLCMLYTPEDFCESLGIYLYSGSKDKSLEGIFVANPETEQLNKNDRFLDKLYLVSAELTAESTDITAGLSVTYELMKTAGDMISHQTMENYSRHGRNDGAVNLYSQQMWGIDEGQERKHFMNLDHIEVTHNSEVIDYLMEERILK